MSLLSRTQAARGLRGQRWTSLSASTISQQPHSRRRNFHVLAAFDQAATWTAESLASIHNLGLPWYITIPLVAAGVNFTCRLPLQYYARTLQAKRTEISPLIHAWGWKHRGAARNGPINSPLDISSSTLNVIKLTRKSQSRIYKAWGLQAWKSFLPFSSMVPFVIFSESLRRLAGVSIWTSGASQAQEVAEGVSLAATAATQNLVEPSLIQGGLLWFTDLTVADPYMGLPIICSALMATTTWGRMTQEKLKGLFSLRNAETQSEHPIIRGFQRLLLLLPVIPLAMSHLPSAIFLYWVSTFSLNHVNDFILSKSVVMPKPKLQPPKRDMYLVRPYLPASPPTKEAKTSS